MSKEDFVTYEQAVALKELGFDYSCDYYYVESTYSTFDRDGETHVKGELMCRFSKYFVAGHCIKAPTIEQAHKWLRSKGLWVEICPEPFDEKGWEFDIYSLKDHFYYSFSFSTVYDTYEEALSDGITECIKILEKECQN